MPLFAQVTIDPDQWAALTGQLQAVRDLADWIFRVLGVLVFFAAVWLGWTFMERVFSVSGVSLATTRKDVS